MLLAKLNNFMNGYYCMFVLAITTSCFTFITHPSLRDAEVVDQVAVHGNYTLTGRQDKY